MSEQVQPPPITSIIDKFPIFMDLSTLDVTQLAAYFRLKRWLPNETIFSEGENSHDLIFIVTGTVSIQKKDKVGDAQEIAKLEGKNVLGEAAFVDNSLRSASAIALSETIGIVMSQDHLEAICEHNPRLAIKLLKKINRLIALKLRKTTREFADVMAGSQPGR